MLNLSFFRAFNAVYGKVGRAASEECVLALLQATFTHSVISNGSMPAALTRQAVF